MSLSEYGIIEDLRPVCGWYYPQPFMDGIQRIPFDGFEQDAASLVKAVRDFREQNRLEIGNVEGDIAQHIAALSPVNDRWKGKPSERIKALKQARHIRLTTGERARQWLKSAASYRPKLISLFDARERAEICVHCPHNMALTTNIGPIDKQMIQEANNLRQRAIMEQDPQLHFCYLHGMLLRAAVFIDIDSKALNHSPETAPQECWNKDHVTTSPAS